MDNGLYLTDLIDVEILQKIQDAFSDLTGIASITTDADGIAVTNGSNFSDFCMKYTRTSPLGCQRCEKCDKHGGEIALEKGASTTYFCHAGLVDFAAPIMAGDKLVGCFIGGQVLTDAPDIKKIINVAEEIGVNITEYLQALMKVHIVKKETIDKAADFLYTISNVLSNIAYHKYQIYQANIEIEKAARMKSDFLANMSHEIRTPLNAIIGMNEMVMREDIPVQAQKYSQDIYNAGQTLLAIINDILDFSKIESGKMEIVPVTYELSSVLNDVINMVTKKVNDKGLKLVTNVSQNIPYQLFGDEVRIRQIILNIVNNAVKYTQKGSVTLSVDWEWIDEVKLLLKLSVTDTGIGIKEEDLQKLFKGFQRVDMATNRNIEGTGLGLAITRRLVEQMDGRITVESVYDQGSTFTVLLPQVVMNDTPMGDFTSAYQRMHKTRERETEHFTAPDARILIVDDNKVNLVVAKGLVKKTMIQIDTVESGIEALEKIKTNRYHIVLLDHMMPEMNGLETIKRMREQEENMSKDAVIIALTANAISGSREMYMAAGFHDYLSKPIDVIKYTEMIRKYLPQELIHYQDT